MTHTADLLDGSVTTPAHQVHQRGHALTGAISAVALGGLALMHFGVDGLISVLVPLQPVLASRTGARPALLGVVVAVALATASLLQPLAARLVRRFGERRVAVAGAFLAALGYGSVLAASDVLQAVAAVAIGGMGSSLFHPAAGALLARAAGAGREAVTLAAFSAVGTAGAAIVPFAVLLTADSLGWGAAVPVAVGLVALTVVTKARVFRGVDIDNGHLVVVATSSGRRVRLAIAAGSMIALAGTTVAASSAVLAAAELGAAHPAVAWVVATYSASGAVGGIVLALWARRIGVRAVLMVAVAAGTVAAAMLPTLPLPLRFVAMAIAGAGLSGSLPLLVSHARRPGESSAAGSVGRILGLAAGVGGAGYAGVGVLQGAVGYATALTGTVLVAGTAALAVAWFLCRSVDPQHCSDAIMIASSTCAAGCST